MIYYAGIGSRKTPTDVIIKMETVGKACASMGMILRSGGAEGADEAFERGCDLLGGTKEIFLPFKGFRRNPSDLYGTTKAARDIARQFHPAWSRLSNTGWDFMGRNSYQVLGPNLDTPSAFIVCWTPSGKVTGGTGQAMRIAKAYNIPILNFGNMSDDEISDKIFAIEGKFNE